MSGGHFGYVGFPIQSSLETISSDEEVKKRFPKLANVLTQLGSALYQIEHDIDWDFSGDSFLKESDAEFEMLALMASRKASQGES